MTIGCPAWVKRHSRLLTCSTFLLLLAAIAGEGFIIWQQGVAHQAAEDQSAKLLNAFLARDTAQAPGRAGVDVRLQNVRFKWSQQVYIDAPTMTIRAVPLQGDVVNFDQPGSFVLAMQQATVHLAPAVLEGMLNESVFNYPGSKVRGLRVTLRPEGGRQALIMSGELRMLVWIPFSMVSYLTVDHATNTLVMNITRMKAFGIIPATKLVRLEPFQLEKIISLPPNNSMIVRGNQIMVKPFGLFPPPRVTGTIASVSSDESGIRLGFAGQAIQAPQSDARNYVYLRGGRAQFGHFQMLDTDVLITEKNPSNLFGFSVLHYADAVARSNIEVHGTRSVHVSMPDS